MERLSRLLIAGLAAGLLLVVAAPRSIADERPLVVGVALTPPLAMRGDNGEWSGLGIELWRLVAADLNWQYEFRIFDLQGLRDALKNRTVDAGIGLLPVTAENDRICDFSQPYLTTGLGLAQRATDPMSLASLFVILFDRRLLSVLAIIVLAVIVVGIIIALIERRSSPDFGGSLRSSVSAGVWWAAVTMTTVGYGDTTPKTTPGRALALVWMFIGVVVVAILTATVTSSLTVTHLRGVVNQPADLARIRLGAVPGGEAVEYLSNRQEHFVTFPDYTSGLKALAERKIDAMIANQPSLRYYVRQDWQGILQVSPLVLEPESFAVAFPNDSPLRQALDSAVIRARQTEAFHDAVHAHIGTF